MISKRHFIKNNKFCFCDEPHLIENYEKAINDTTQTWDCHHRLEIMPWSGKVVSSKYLMEQGLYLHQPPLALIFITHSEHTYLHNKGKCSSKETKKKMSKSWDYDKHFTKEIKSKLSASKQNRHWYNNGLEEKWCSECPPNFKQGRLSK